MKKLLSLTALVVGCGAGMRVTNIGGDTEKPASVRVLLAVDIDKKPLTDLTRANFTVFEDDAPVAEPDVIVAMPDLSDEQRTLVLLDMSGSPSPAEASAMALATRRLLAPLGRQKTAVYAFDGAPDLAPIVAFGTPEAVASQKLDTLTQFKPRDTSSNLYGAIIAASKILAHEVGNNLMAGGTLVTVYRDADHAARASQKDLADHLAKPEYARVRRYAIALGDVKASVGAAGATEQTRASAITLGDEMERVGKILAQVGTSYYFLGVCSRARAGEHELRIDIARTTTNSKGNEVVQRGSLRHKFSAEGFSAGCAPKVPTEIAALSHGPDKNNGSRDGGRD